MRISASIIVDAPPERVYPLLSDVTQLGRLSPECYRCEWNDGSSQGAVGSTFTGYNRIGDRKWTTQCEVVAADPDRLFAFEVCGPDCRYSRWTYALEPEGSGTRVSERFELFTLPSVLQGAGPEYLARREAMLQDGMNQTLARLKEVVERGQ
jgi:uncharacterized protein YndB with AHSA1/START domain